MSHQQDKKRLVAASLFLGLAAIAMAATKVGGLSLVSVSVGVVYGWLSLWFYYYLIKNALSAVEKRKKWALGAICFIKFLLLLLFAYWMSKQPMGAILTATVACLLVVAGAGVFSSKEERHGPLAS